MGAEPSVDRRSFLRSAAAVGGAMAVGSFAAARLTRAAESQTQTRPSEKPISPVEDLMREHGVIERLLLIYGEADRRIAAGQPAPLAAVEQAAKVMRDFVENYHEKLEEENLFPRFRQAGQQVDLVEVLYAQHQAGRRVTERIIAMAGEKAATSPAGAAGAAELSKAMRAVIAMYRPHAARENTVLFPAFGALVSDAEYARLADQFEDKEHELFGPEGFEGVVVQVGLIEQTLGINDLAQFTPKG
jgi:hemerythrin-like domain-containing protein